MPRKRYTEFQHAWFSHIGHYIDGIQSSGAPASKPTRTRSGRRIKDLGAQYRVEAVDCKTLWGNFIQSITPHSLSINDQRILVSDH